MTTGHLAFVDQPSGWKWVRFDRLCRRRQDVGRPDLQPLSVYLGIGVVPRSDRTDNHNRLGEDLSKYLVVKPGDVVFNKLRTWQGGLGVSRFEGIVSPAYFVLRPDDGVTPRFLHHLLLSSAYLAELTRRSKWMPPSQFDIPWDELRTLPVLVPPVAVQNRIATFLDRKTAAIDALIAKKERLIELLQEKRQALITEAVTRGLNRDAPKKNSGVEWFGEIPAHWQVSAVKHVTQFVVDGVHQKPEYVDDGIPFVTVKNLTSGTGVDLSDVNRISEEDHRLFTRRVAPCRGDVLITKDGATLGVCRVVETDEPFSIFVSVALLKLRKALVDPYFFRFVMESFIVQQQFKLMTKGSALPHLHLNVIESVLLPLPPLREQSAIGEHIKRLFEHFELLVRSVKKHVDLLREYRQTLISAAVTGKLDIPSEDAA